MLLTEEWTRTGTAWRCDTCEVDLPSLASHVSPLLREGNHHIAYKEMLQQKLQQLASDGWTPRYEGVVINNKRCFECKLCNKNARWYNVWNHLCTKNHAKKTLRDGP